MSVLLAGLTARLAAVLPLPRVCAVCRLRREPVLTPRDWVPVCLDCLADPDRTEGDR